MPPRTSGQSRRDSPEIPGGPVRTPSTPTGPYTEGEARHPHPVPNPGPEGRAGPIGLPTGLSGLELTLSIGGLSRAWDPAAGRLPGAARASGRLAEPQAKRGCRGGAGWEGSATSLGKTLLTHGREAERGWRRRLFPSHREVSGGGSAAPWCHLGLASAPPVPLSAVSCPGLSCLACFSGRQVAAGAPGHSDGTGQEAAGGPGSKPGFCLAGVFMGSGRGFPFVRHGQEGSAKVRPSRAHPLRTRRTALGRQLTVPGSHPLGKSWFSDVRPPEHRPSEGGGASSFPGSRLRAGVSASSQQGLKDKTPASFTTGLPAALLNQVASLHSGETPLTPHVSEAGRHIRETAFSP